MSGPDLLRRRATARSRSGVWACTPGGWAITDRPDTETVRILSGRARLTDAGGRCGRARAPATSWSCPAAGPAAGTSWSRSASCTSSSVGRMPDPTRLGLDPISISGLAAGARHARPSPVAALDLIAADSLLSEEERAIRDTVRTYLDREVRPARRGLVRGRRAARPRAGPGARRARRARHAPATGYGCAGTSAVAYGLACLELEAGRLRHPLAGLGAGLAGDVRDPRSTAPRSRSEQWLPRMAAGEAIGCFGLTEPDFGSNPAGMRTRAKRGRRRLGARRHQDVDHQRRRRRRRDRLGADGRRASAASSSPPTRRASPRNPVKHKLSLRASVTSELVLDGVRLPAVGDAARRPRAGRPARLPERGPVRDRLRRAGRGPRLPGDRHRVRR